MRNPSITIIQDSREQCPLHFKHKYIKEVRVEKLDVGDYGAEFGDGHRLPLIFERKSVNDLWGTLSQGYERFRKEFARAKELGQGLIIIVEGSLTRVGMGCGHSSRSAESVIYQIFTMRARYGIETVFCAHPDETAHEKQHFYVSE
jgi:ERCC4-type nuclease